MELLPIGTIIEIDEVKLMIMGYRSFQSGRFDFFYIVSLFSIGFTGERNSLSLIPIEKEYTVVKLGFVDDSVKQYLHEKNNYITSLQDTKPEDIERVLELMSGREEN